MDILSTLAPLKSGYVIVSSETNTLVIKCPDEVKFILLLNRAIMYPLGALGTKLKIVWGNNPLIVREANKDL